MRKNELHAEYMSDDERFADFINGVVFDGEQVVSAVDISERDTRIEAGNPGRKEVSKQRDLLKKIAMGTNFIVVGIENQEEVHYLMPLRVMSYDASEYEQQAKLIKKAVLKEKGLNSAEFLSGFKKNSKLFPCVTFVLYYGKDWGGSRDLYGLLDFSGRPKKLRKYVANYPVHLIEVRKFKNTDVFKTDLKLVFDFIKYSEDKEKLKKLVESNEAYKNMATDAYAVAVAYTKSESFIGIEECKKEGGKIDMCRALAELKDEGRLEGRLEGVRSMIFDNIEEDIPIERIVQKLKKYFDIEENEADRLIAEALSAISV